MTEQAPASDGTLAPGAESSDRAIAARPNTGAGASAARPAALALLGGTAVVALAADLTTKQLAMAQLAGQEPVQLLGGALYLTLTYNSGAAFSIGRDYTIVFPIITIVVVAGIGWLARQLRSLPWAAAMGLILGGALGNLVDRVFRSPGPLRGHVVDFLSLFDEAGRAFPIFNLADTALFCGVVLALALELTGRRRDGRRIDRVRVRGSTGGAD